jgi:hypothetical protein
MIPAALSCNKSRLRMAYLKLRCLDWFSVLTPGYQCVNWKESTASIERGTLSTHKVAFAICR